MGVWLGAAYLLQIPPEHDWPGEPFLLFLLVVIGTTLCFGTRLGLISAALSACLSVYFFEPVGSPTLRYASDLNKIMVYATIAFGCAVSVAHFCDTLIDKSDPGNNRSMLLREILHGLANKLAVVPLIKTGRNTKAKSVPESEAVGNELCREMIQAIPAAIYVTDAKGRITYYNEAAAALWGCRPELGDSKFCGSWKLYWPDGTPLPHDECPMALHKERPFRGVEAVAERPDGTRIAFIPYPTPLFDPAGRLAGAVNMLVDISERRLAEQDRQRLTAIVASSEDAIISKDLCGIVTSWNPGAQKLFGYAPAELIGKSISLLIPAHLQYEESNILKRIALGERIEHFETTRVRKDGMLVRVSLSISPIRNAHGSVVGVSSIARDVTHNKQAEQALADRNRQLELAAKHALVGRFATEIDVARGDLKSQRAQVSPGFAAIYGLPEETTEISVGDWRSLVHSDDLPQYLEHSQKVFAERRGEHHAEFRIVRPSGTIRWIEARSFIDYDQAGHARRLVGVNIDITERKRAEEAREILNAELDHRVKNALATVAAVISHTQQGSGSVADFAVALDGRIRSMAATHELLSSHQWHGVSLMKLIRRELAPYATRNNTEINGPPVLLKPEAGRAIAMVLHELATNAAKYGALSSKDGRVAIRWDQYLNGHARSLLVFEWQEIGGPPVIAVGKSSYGTSTIRDLIPYEFGGTVDLVLAREGVRCRLELPSDWLSNDRQAFSATGAHA